MGPVAIEGGEAACCSASRAGAALLVASAVSMLAHVLLGMASVGGTYGDDGSGGALGIFFLSSLGLAMFAYACDHFLKRGTQRAVRGPERSTG